MQRQGVVLGRPPFCAAHRHTKNAQPSRAGLKTSCVQPAGRLAGLRSTMRASRIEAVPTGRKVQYLWDEGLDLAIFKNDEKTCDEIRAMNPRGILISPGPGAPEESGICLQACTELGPSFPLFGVCMGHQCIGQAFGGKVVRAPTGLMHGKQSPIFHDAEDVGGLLQGLPSPFMGARYHSLAVAREGFPEEELKVTAWVEDGTIMGLRHRKYPWIQGVQFHPESIITDNGKLIIKNWIAGLSP